MTQHNLPISNKSDVHGSQATIPNGKRYSNTKRSTLVWSMILQPILHTSTEEACENRLAVL